MPLRYWSKTFTSGKSMPTTVPLLEETNFSDKSLAMHTVAELLHKQEELLETSSVLSEEELYDYELRADQISELIRSLAEAHGKEDRNLKD